ncbi:uncharacterized protein LOC111057370 [Nilaparvata lugens]|uniref:uncharacterized protein LOC111057370 n=1 Tax=Nilaparvata lugens TaxID=108931 RepID=UPI00193EB38D|nr:uncharacterized protein LOC111057370 [Nilaparvata lugens]XP_039283096.1 uncharacterized protein LOC111057370 [Nilaparvata lugens]XP_039283097.1 uncharacterized protein LOC111057370 [Nilaparvata lugens]
MEEIEELTKNLVDNTKTIVKYLDSYNKKAAEVSNGLKEFKDNTRHTLEFRQRCYKARNLLSKLSNYTCELLMDMEMTDPLVDEDECDIIQVPYLPAIEGESQKNHQFEVQFLHGKSPWSFWLCHNDEDTTRKLENLLQQGLNNLQELANPICGDYVLHKQDNKLSRALVQQIHSERYHILLIDQGTTSMTRLKRLFKMDKEISLIPHQALKCTLIKDPKDSSLWRSEVDEVFFAAMEQCKLTVEIIEEIQDFPTRFLVKVKAQDIEDDTENTVDLGKWVTDRIIPALKSGKTLKGSVFDAFYSQDDEEDYNSDSSSKSCQTSPIIELPHDDDDRVSSRTDEKVSLEIVAVSTTPATITNTNTQTSNYRHNYNSNAINAPILKKIAANFNEYPGGDYPVNQTSNVMTVYRPVMQLHQNTNPMRGYPLISSPPVMGLAMRPPPPAGLNRNYPTPPAPIGLHSLHRPNASSWSTNGFNTVVNHNYEVAKYELKTPVVLVRPNEELRAICSYVVSPNEFYVHLVNKNNSKMDLLQTDLENFYKNCNPTNWQMHPTFKYCACKYVWTKDQPSAPLSTWYRAEVISIEENEAFLFLVDFGVKLWRKFKDLRVLDQRFFAYDKMAQRCRLQNVPMMENEVYSKDVTKYLTSLLISKDGHYEELKMTIVHNSHAKESSLAVIVRLEDGSVNDKVIEYIKSIDPNFKNEVEWDPMANDYFAETNRMDHVIDNALMATSGYIPKDEERLCRFYRETGRCPKKACRQEHEFMGDGIFTIDRTETFTQTFRRQQLPEEGYNLVVKVLNNGCISPTRFYGHWKYVNDEKNSRNNHNPHKNVNYEFIGEDDDNIYDDFEDEETLITLMEALNAPNNTQKYKHLGVLPAIAEMVIAKVIDEDGRAIWFRAKVHDVQEVDKRLCDVFLIDFGVTRSIPLNYLRVMEPRFLHLPPQATEFCLAGIEVLEDEWGPHEPPTSILSQWENRFLIAFVTKRNFSDETVEVDLQEENGESLRQVLRKTGKYRPIAINNQSLEDGCIVPG